MSVLLQVDALRVSYATPKGTMEAVRGVSFALGHERLGIVGESGSGKTQTGRAILGLTGPNARVSAKRITLGNTDLLHADARTWRGVRGARISMIMQDPKFSLNPVISVGKQVEEAFRIHARGTRREARERTLDMLAAVRIRNPRRVYHAYPHELSGGMGQRIMIAMMMIPNPEVMIADEPTSALDVTVQMQVLAILDDMVSDRGMGLILISHDLNLVASFCDRVLIMYAGQVMEALNANELHRARHPYTRGLMSCVPQLAHRTRELPVLQRDPQWLQPLGD